MKVVYDIMLMIAAGGVFLALLMFPMTIGVPRYAARRGDWAPALTLATYLAGMASLAGLALYGLQGLS
jgi:hypothetical protein